MHFEGQVQKYNYLTVDPITQRESAAIFCEVAYMNNESSKSLDIWNLECSKGAFKYAGIKYL